MHCISCENEDPKETYKTVYNELKKYDKSLVAKEEIILFTKTDLIDAKKLDSFLKAFKKTHEHIFAVSILDDKSLKALSDELVKILKEV